MSDIGSDEFEDEGGPYLGVNFVWMFCTIKFTVCFYRKLDIITSQNTLLTVNIHILLCAIKCSLKQFANWFDSITFVEIYWRNEWFAS